MRIMPKPYHRRVAPPQAPYVRLFKLTDDQIRMYTQRNGYKARTQYRRRSSWENELDVEEGPYGSRSYPYWTPNDSNHHFHSNSYVWIAPPFRSTYNKPWSRQVHSSSVNSQSTSWSRNSAPYATKHGASIETYSPRQAQSWNTAGGNGNSGGRVQKKVDPSTLNLLAALESENSAPLADLLVSEKREPIKITIRKPKQHETYSCSLTSAFVDELENVHSPVDEVSDESAVLDEIVTLDVSSDRVSSPAVNAPPPSTASAPFALEPLDLGQNTVSLATISPILIQRQPEQIPFIGDVDLYSDISNDTSPAYSYNSDSSQSPKLVICESSDDDEHDDANPGLTLQMESSPLCVTPNILDSELATSVSEAVSNSMFEIHKPSDGPTDNSGPSGNASHHESQPPAKAPDATTKDSNDPPIAPGVETQNKSRPNTKRKQQDCENIKPSDDDSDVIAPRISIRRNFRKHFLESDEDELTLKLSPPKKRKYTKRKPPKNPSPKSNQRSSLIDKDNNIKKNVTEKRRNAIKIIPPSSSPSPTKSSTPVKMSNYKIPKKSLESTGSTDSNKTATSDSDCENNHDGDGSKRLRTDALLNSKPPHSQLKLPPSPFLKFGSKTIKGKPATRINPVGYCQIKSYLKRQPDHQWALGDSQGANLDVNMNTVTAKNPAASKTTPPSQPSSTGNTNRPSETKCLAQNNRVAANTMLGRRERCKSVSISRSANLHENLQTSATHDPDGRKTPSRSRRHSIAQTSVREPSPPVTVKSTAGAATEASGGRDPRLSASREREKVPVQHPATGTSKTAQPDHRKSTIESSRSQLPSPRHTPSNQETMSHETKASAGGSERSSRKSSSSSHSRPTSRPQSPSHAHSKHPHEKALEKESTKSEGERKSISSHERRKSVSKSNSREKSSEPHTSKPSHSHSRAQSPSLSKSKSSQDHDKSVGRPEVAGVSVRSHSSHSSSPHSKSKHAHEKKVVSDSHDNSSGKSSKRDHRKSPAQTEPSQHSKTKHEHDEATVERNEASRREKTHSGKSTSHHRSRSSTKEDRDKHKVDSGSSSVSRSSPKKDRDKYKVESGSSSPKEDRDKHKVDTGSSSPKEDRDIHKVDSGSSAPKADRDKHKADSGSSSVSRSSPKKDGDGDKVDSGSSSVGGISSSTSHSRPSSPQKPKRRDSHKKEEKDKAAVDEILKPASSKERRKSVSHSRSHPIHIPSNISINHPENYENAPLEEKVIFSDEDRSHLASPLHTASTSSTGTKQLEKYTSTQKCVSEDAPLKEKCVCLHHPASPPYVPSNTSTNQPEMNTSMEVTHSEDAPLNEKQTSSDPGRYTPYTPFYTTTNHLENNTNHVKCVSENVPIKDSQVSIDLGRSHTETPYTLSETNTNQPEKEACVSQDAPLKEKSVSIDQGHCYLASRPYAPSHTSTNQPKMDANTSISVVGTLKEKQVSSDQGPNHLASTPSNICTNQTAIDGSKERSVSDNAIQTEKETSCDEGRPHPATPPYTPSKTSTHQPDKQIDFEISIPEYATRTENQVVSDHAHYSLASRPCTPFYTSTIQAGKDTSGEKSVAEVVPRKEGCASCDHDRNTPASTPYTPSKTTTNQLGKDTRMEITGSERAPRIENQVASDEGCHRVESHPYTPYYNSTIQPENGMSREYSIAEDVPKKEKGVSSASTPYTPSNTSTNQSEEKTCIGTPISDYAPQKENQVFTPVYTISIKLENGMSSEKSMAEDVPLEQNRICSDQDRSHPASTPHTSSNTSTNQLEMEKCGERSDCEKVTPKQNQVSGYNPASRPFAPSITSTNQMDMNTERCISKDHTLKEKQVSSNPGISNSEAPTRSPSPQEPTVQEQELAKQIEERLLGEVSPNPCQPVHQNRTNSHASEEIVINTSCRTPDRRPEDDKQKLVDNICCSENASTRMDIGSLVTIENDNSSRRTQQHPEVSSIDPADAPTRMNTPDSSFKASASDSVRNGSAVFSHAAPENPVGMYHIEDVNLPGPISQWIENFSSDLMPQPNSVTFYTGGTEQSEESDKSTVETTQPATVPCAVAALPPLTIDVSVVKKEIEIIDITGDDIKTEPAVLKCRSPRNLGVLTAEEDSILQSLTEFLKISLAAYKYHAHITSIVNNASGSQVILDQVQRQLKQTLAQQAEKACIIVNNSQEMFKRNELYPVMLRIINAESEIKYKECDLKTVIKMLVSFDNSLFTTLYTNPLSGVGVPEEASAEIDAILNNVDGNGRSSFETNGTTSNNSTDQLLASVVPECIPPTQPAECQIQYEEPMQMNYGDNPSLLRTSPTEINAGLAAGAIRQVAPPATNLHNQSDSVNPLGRMPVDLYNGQSEEQRLVDAMFSQPIDDPYSQMHPHRRQQQQRLIPQNTPAATNQNQNTTSYQMPILTEQLSDRNAQEIRNRNFQMQQAMDQYRRAQFNNGNNGCSPRNEPRPITSIQQDATAHGVHRNGRGVEMQQGSRVTAPSCQRENPWGIAQQQHRVADSHPSHSVPGLAVPYDQRPSNVRPARNSTNVSPNYDPSRVQLNTSPGLVGPYDHQRPPHMHQAPHRNSTNVSPNYNPSSGQLNTSPGLAAPYDQRPANIRQAPHRNSINLSPNYDPSSVHLNNASYMHRSDAQPRNIQPSHSESDRQTYRPPSRTMLRGRGRGGKNRGRGRAVRPETGRASTVPNIPTNQYVPPPPYNENIPYWTNGQYPPPLFSYEASRRPYPYPFIAPNSMRQPPEHHSRGASPVHAQGPPKEKKGRSRKSAKQPRHMEPAPMQINTPASSHVPVTRTIPPTYNTAAHFQHIPGMVFPSDLPPGQRADEHILQNLLTGCQVSEMSQLPDHNKRQAMNANASEQAAQARAERHVPQPGGQSCAPDRRMPPVERPQAIAPAAPVAQQLPFHLLNKQIVECAKYMNAQGQKSAAQDHPLNFSQTNNNTSGDRFDNIRPVPTTQPNGITNPPKQAAQEPPRMHPENNLRLVRTRMWKPTQAEQSTSTVTVSAVNTSPLVCAAVMPQLSAPSTTHAELPPLLPLLSLTTSGPFQNNSHRAILSMPDLSTSYFSTPRSAEPTTEENISESNNHAIRHTTPTQPNIGYGRSTTLHPADDVMSDDDDESTHHFGNYVIETTVVEDLNCCICAQPAELQCKICLKQIFCSLACQSKHTCPM